MKNSFFAGLLSLTIMISCQPDKQLTNYVNPLLGTATLWETKDLGYERHLKTRTWGAEVFPGSSVPNAMVQLSPVTQFRSGAGYQYEDTVIYGFSHTNKGHWNLLHLPVLPVTGNVSSGDYASTYSHSNESARPGYYQVFLERYGVNAELTSTLRCAYHKYTFRPDDDKKVLVDITRTNNGVRDWSIQKVDDYTFSGNQDAEGNILVGDHVNIDTTNTISFSSGKMIATIGVDNLVVVETEDAILVCDKNRVQDVKKVVDTLNEQGRTDLL